MRLPSEWYQMKQTIETQPHLSRPQLTGLVLWVMRDGRAGSACQNAVAAALSTRGNWNNMRQYLREWLYDGGDRARPCGTELDVKPLPHNCCDGVLASLGVPQAFVVASADVDGDGGTLTPGLFHAHVVGGQRLVEHLSGSRSVRC